MLRQNNKNAWPFIEPVDPDEVPNYYKVIKEPMGESHGVTQLASRPDERQFESGWLPDFFHEDSPARIALTGSEIRQRPFKRTLTVGMA